MNLTTIQRVREIGQAFSRDQACILSAVLARLSEAKPGENAQVSVGHPVVTLEIARVENNISRLKGLIADGHKGLAKDLDLEERLFTTLNIIQNDDALVLKSYSTSSEGKWTAAIWTVACSSRDDDLEMIVEIDICIQH